MSLSISNPLLLVRTQVTAHMCRHSSNSFASSSPQIRKDPHQTQCEHSRRSAAAAYVFTCSSTSVPLSRPPLKPNSRDPLLSRLRKLALAKNAGGCVAAPAGVPQHEKIMSVALKSFRGCTLLPALDCSSTKPSSSDQCVARHLPTHTFAGLAHAVHSTGSPTGRSGKKSLRRDVDDSASGTKPPNHLHTTDHTGGRQSSGAPSISDAGTPNAPRDEAQNFSGHTLRGLLGCPCISIMSAN